MTNSKSNYPIGVIHGRFQILHNDHLKYLLAGKKLCDHLIVGIANPDPSQSRYTKANPHRNTEFANPLTYYERFILIQEALLEYDSSLTEFSIVPFPINTPDLISYYVPMDAVFFLTIYDEWGRKKKTIFEQLGVNIHLLWEVPLEEKGLRSKDIRELIFQDKKWDHLVPQSVAKSLKNWDIRTRLKEIRDLI